MLPSLAGRRLVTCLGSTLARTIVSLRAGVHLVDEPLAAGGDEEHAVAFGQREHEGAWRKTSVTNPSASMR
jgi:hypothetical protein